MEYNFLEYSKEQLSSLLPELIKEKKVLLIREIFDEYNIVDLSEIFSELELDEAIFIFKILPKDISAELFTYLDPLHQERLISAHDKKQRVFLFQQQILKSALQDPSDLLLAQ